MMPTECGIKATAVVHIKPTIKNPYLKETDPIVHYGVKGQHWGVITKEYEPVAVDHRRTGNNGYQKQGLISRSIGGMRNKIRAREEKEIAAFKAERAKGRAIRQKALKYGGYAGAALIGILIAYGSYKYVHMNKAKAYSGLLSRFLEMNPAAKTNTPAGRMLLKSGVEKARMNSRHLSDAISTNQYLKSRGLNVGKSQAKRIYSARGLIKRMANMKSGTGKYSKAVQQYRRNRLQSKIFDKIYF